MAGDFGRIRWPLDLGPSGPAERRRPDRARGAREQAPAGDLPSLVHRRSSCCGWLAGSLYSNGGAVPPHVVRGLGYGSLARIGAPPNPRQLLVGTRRLGRVAERSRRPGEPEERRRAPGGARQGECELSLSLREPLESDERGSQELVGRLVHERRAEGVDDTVLGEGRLA